MAIALKRANDLLKSWIQSLPTMNKDSPQLKQLVKCINELGEALQPGFKQQVLKVLNTKQNSADWRDGWI